jgi:hypothetical protein
MNARSSKALFRATKAKPDRGTALPFDLHIQEAPKANRRADDFYPTGQPEAIRALLAHDGKRISRSGNVWEPACGDGAMVKEIRAMGMECQATDLVDRGCPESTVSNYYDHKESLAAAIITNPPYCEINARDGHGRWLRHSLEMHGWDYMALLLSWDWPAARANGLGALLDKQPFSYCYLMRWKLDFTGEGSPPQRNAWYVWDRKWVGEPAFRWMDRTDCRQEKLL